MSPDEHVVDDPVNYQRLAVTNCSLSTVRISRHKLRRLTSADLVLVSPELIC